jgi:hypothetical protein
MARLFCFTLNMAISRKDKKLIFDYLLEAVCNGLFFGKILQPHPEPVRSGGMISMKSVRKVESTEEERARGTRRVVAPLEG